MKKYSFLYLLLGFGLLLLFSQKVLLPLVYDVVKSDAFLEDTKDLPSQYPISNEMTDLAFLHCNNHIKTQLGDDGASATFAPKPVKSWTLGNHHYLINGEITTTGNNAGQHKYVCRITYENGEKLDGAQDAANWTIEGIDGIEGL